MLPCNSHSSQVGVGKILGSAQADQLGPRWQHTACFLGNWIWEGAWHILQSARGAAPFLPHCLTDMLGIS